MKIQNLRGMLLILFSIATLTLTACGGGDDPSDDAPPTANATAHAGSDQDISLAQSITLDGSGSTDPDGDSLSYRWTQTHGPDVTGGNQVLTGASPSFNAPENVSTLRFELRVNDGHGESRADVVQINIMEDAAHALFVNGDTGNNDTGDGSRSLPFATIRHAVTQVTPGQEDIYVMALTDETQRYDESSATLDIPDGTSLYGGYSAEWIRNVTETPTRVRGAASAIHFITPNSQTWFSGFNLQTAGTSSPSDSLYAIKAQDGSGILVVEDNTITTGDAATNRSTTPGSNYGIIASNSGT